MSEVMVIVLIIVTFMVSFFMILSLSLIALGVVGFYAHKKITKQIEDDKNEILKNYRELETKTDFLIQELEKFNSSRFIIDNMEIIIGGIASIELNIKEILEMNIFDDHPILVELLQNCNELLDKIDGMEAIFKLEV